MAIPVTARNGTAEIRRPKSSLSCPCGGRRRGGGTPGRARRAAYGGARAPRPSLATSGAIASGVVATSSQRIAPLHSGQTGVDREHVLEQPGPGVARRRARLARVAVGEERELLGRASGAGLRGRARLDLGHDVRGEHTMNLYTAWL